MQDLIEVAPDNMGLAWTPQWPLSSVVMVDIVADEEKYGACVKITITCVADRNMLLKNCLWFEAKPH